MWMQYTYDWTIKRSFEVKVSDILLEEHSVLYKYVSWLSSFPTSTTLHCLLKETTVPLSINFNWLKEKVSVSSPAPMRWGWCLGEVPLGTASPRTDNIIPSRFCRDYPDALGPPVVGWRQSNDRCNLVLIWGWSYLVRRFHLTDCSFGTLPIILQVEVASNHPTTLTEVSFLCNSYNFH